ncbi:MAG: AAA family ATPase [Cyclobacteriaceae bacterium]
MTRHLKSMENPNDIIKKFDAQGYVLDEELATILYLMGQLEKPLLLEGNPGVGKTEVANVLAACLGTDLIRLQCHEGLDISSAVYEWNYQKQLLSIKIQEQSELTEKEKEQFIFSRDFLLERPLLKSILSSDRSPVLLIDEIDRADEEFEAYLLELLSVFQISIPELGTLKAKHKPLVILTSNCTRELSDALKRRCLYHWVPYPDMEKEIRIVRKHLPDIETQLVQSVVKVINELREMQLNKVPGIAETLDWSRALLALGLKSLDPQSTERTLGCLLKSLDDIEMIKGLGLEEMLERAKVG